jgi:hypothetical protein
MAMSGWFKTSDKKKVAHYFFDNKQGCKADTIISDVLKTLVKTTPEDRRCDICQDVERYDQLSSGPCPCESGFPFADCHGLV